MSELSERWGIEYRDGAWWVDGCRLETEEEALYLAMGAPQETR